MFSSPYFLTLSLKQAPSKVIFSPCIQSEKLGKQEPHTLHTNSKGEGNYKNMGKIVKRHRWVQEYSK